MNQKNFTVPGYGEVRFYFSRDHITVVYPVQGQEPDAICVPWDLLTDVEYLSLAFENSTVRVFREIVTQLGTVNQNRNIYEALL